MPFPRTIFHIDMNSYFASVAEQMNPHLRGKAIGVGGKPGTRGIIAAASREAKLRGVKTAMSAYEALRACPELLIVDGDMDAVLDITNKFLTIFRRYTDEVEVFSVDEAFLDVTGWHARWGGPVALAQRIKDDIRREIGECITCSVGIAENKLLAKLASDLKKPDGLVVLTKNDFRSLAITLPVTELCGIAERLARRLDVFGIKTVADLGRADMNLLVDEFGPVMGTKLWMMGRGEDPSPVVSVVDSPKSFSHSYTLPTDTTDRAALHGVLFALAEKVARRMRREGFAGRHIGGYVRYGNFSGAGDGLTMKTYTDDGLVIYRTIKNLLRPHLVAAPVRALGVSVSDLGHHGQLPLFDDIRRRRALLTAADDINNRYGERTLEPVGTLGVLLKRHVSGFHHALPVSVKGWG